MPLAAGTQIIGETSRNSWTIQQFLGSGGQGEVYRVGDGKQDLALKWYFPDQATPQQRDNLRDLIQRGIPSNRFLWPIDVVTIAGNPSYGYVMPLRTPNFKGLQDMMKRRIDPTFRVLCTACFELAHHYFVLHSRGLAYRDISFGNIFFDPQTGEIRIADNDNVCVNGTPLTGVVGTPRFMAPEIVRRQATPSTDTDLFSLSVLLFYMLFMHHPLEGKREADIRCFDLPAMNRLYGEDPLFIFNPQDASNRPVPGYQDNALIYWSIYPQFIRDLFTRAFTDGLRPEGRVRESEWRRALSQLRDSIIFGPAGDENFFDEDKYRKGEPHHCWNTKKPVALPLALRINGQSIMLTPATILHAHHLNPAKPFDFSRGVARVIKHPSDPNILGLQNDSDNDWSYTDADGRLQSVPVGKRVTLRPDLTLNFGAVQGKIVSL